MSIFFEDGRLTFSTLLFIFEKELFFPISSTVKQQQKQNKDWESEWGKLVFWLFLGSIQWHQNRGFCRNRNTWTRVHDCMWIEGSFCSLEFIFCLVLFTHRECNIRECCSCQSLYWRDCFCSLEPFFLFSCNCTATDSSVRQEFLRMPYTQVSLVIFSWIERLWIEFQK
jgi:hypothetical protein